MIQQKIQLTHNHQVVVDRFVAACQSDARIVAAFLGGSYASGTADAHSDLDLYLITTEEGYEAFLAEREPFVRGWAIRSSWKILGKRTTTSLSLPMARK